MSITYKPSLTYKKNYQSEAVFNEEDESILISDQIEEQESDDLTIIKEKAVIVNTLKELLPKEINKIIEAVGDEIVKVIEKETEKYIPFKKEEEIKVEDKTDKNNDNPSNDFLFDDSEEDTVDIIIDNTPNYELIESIYKTDLVNVFKHYFVNLEKTLNNFSVELLLITNSAGITDLTILNNKYEGHTLDLSKDLYALSDYIIKSQIVRDQQTRLASKLFTPQETMYKIKSLKVAADLKKRYEEIEYKPNKNFDSLIQNDILSQSKFVYEKKYKENLLNLYKYLNSTVILINDNLMSYLKEVEAKALLIKQGGI